MATRPSREIYLIADRIRSMHNVGSLFRSADAFAVKKIFLCGYTAVPPRPEIAKVALGAEHTVPWQRELHAWRLIERLRRAGVMVVALEQTDHSPSLASFTPRFPLALIVGNEISGISPTLMKRADVMVHIPMLGKKESLNVSVAAGIALFALRYPSI